ncbi:InlB B-repeat-containing protein [Wenyingzhuangia heitensis]|uniref:InlB B-repeat-containing protein n=1 Tax=Wenyingzhuangia heitensis TaxID=1487859 RepID=UPI00374474B7
MIVLTATLDDEYQFNNWSKDTSETTNRLSTTMNTDKKENNLLLICLESTNFFLETK